jgi:DNA-binding CsgD family transcriptional regulator
MALWRADFEAVVDFLARVDAIDAAEPYATEVLSALRTLIPCDTVGYDEADVDAGRFLDSTPETEADDALYWATGPCPITEYRLRTGDATAARISDVIGRARWHEQPVYREYFAPVGLDHILDIGLSPNRRHYRDISLFRGGDVPDFSERDRAVLELLRPHFRAREARAALLDYAAGLGPAGGGDPDERDARLTIREREVVALVAAGKTNAQVAAALWVTPATVKKHLENVYLKLGVGTRAGAVGALRAWD